MPSRIVNITDCIDIAGNELRASLLNIVGNDPNILIEPPVPINPAFSAINANFAVRLMADAYPPGTILFTTINAEKVRPPNALGRTNEKELIFLGRNLGSFDWITRDFGCRELFDLTQHYTGEFVSFAGKFITAPIAAKAAKGVPLSDLGNPIPVDSIFRLKLATGTIVHVDNFGMMKFTGELEGAGEGDRYQVTINESTVEAVYGKRLMSFETGTWVLFPGSSFGLFELGKVRELGAKFVEAKVGDMLTWKRVGGPKQESK